MTGRGRIWPRGVVRSTLAGMLGVIARRLVRGLERDWCDGGCGNLTPHAYGHTWRMCANCWHVHEHEAKR